MNETFLSRIGKLFFPRLATDQRHQRMVIVVLVLAVCLFATGTLSLWMLSTRGTHLAGPSYALPRALQNK